MATATGDPTFLQEQPPQHPPPQQAVTHPTYPQMIMEAINALNDKNGASKSAISRQIETVHPDLSPAHNNLLNHYLNIMKSTGQLVFLKNNYSIPDPDAPPRRGRGRPPKPKDHNAPPPAPAGISSTRGRGRPPKDPSAPPPPPKAKPPPSGRPRGRPPKKAKTDAGPSAPAPAPAPEGERRGRGRPPKVKAPVAPVAGVESLVS